MALDSTRAGTASTVRASAGHSNAPERASQTWARCVLPQPGGPCNSTAEAGQSGQPSSRAMAASLLGATRKSSAPKAGRSANSRTNCDVIAHCHGCRIVDRAGEVLSQGKADQDTEDRRDGHRDEEAEQTEQVAEGEQREDDPDRMKIDALADQPGGQEIALGRLADDEDGGDGADR